jgi:pimeloyl-ACP methyl ester carboxylesterase
VTPPLRAAGLLALLSAALSGCAGLVLANRIVQAPNRNGAPRMVRDPKAAELFGRTYAQAWRVRVGPPPAELSVAVIEPGNYELKEDIKLTNNPDGSGRMDYSINWAFLAPDSPKMKARATLVLLHGVLVSKEYMLHWAIYLAQKGYRTVIVDLRGHGASTGKWITYGAVERTDMRQVLDELRRRGLANGSVGVLGVSYGAAVALDWAAIDARVGSVVVLEPFSDARKAIVEFSRGYDAKDVKGITDAQFASAELEASRIAGFKWEDADDMRSIRRLRVPVLIFHGRKDTWIPPAHSDRLMAAAPPGSRLRILPNDNHLTLSTRLDPIAPEVAEWFGDHLGERAAPDGAGR